MQNKFSSTQIAVPGSIASKIQSWGKENIPESKVYIDPDDSSFGREDDVHITVKFGLHTNNPKDVEKVVSEFGKIAIDRLGKVSRFTSDEYDVIKIDVHSKDLHRLNSLISQSLECTDTHPTYNPHITIAYVEKDSCNNLIDNEEFAGLQWSLSELDFSSQDGKKTTIRLTA